MTVALPEKITLLERNRIDADPDYAIELRGGIVFREQSCGSWWERNILMKTEFVHSDEALYASVTDDDVLYVSPYQRIYYPKAKAESIAAFVKKYGITVRYFSNPVEY